MGDYIQKKFIPFHFCFILFFVLFSFMGEDVRAPIQAGSRGSMAMTKVEICKKKFEAKIKIYKGPWFLAINHLSFLDHHHLANMR